jgi:Tol biopolymer transport system component
MARWRRLVQIVLLLAGLLCGTPAVPTHAEETTVAMLAVVGEDGNLTLYDKDGAAPRSVTTDATPGEKMYHWPTWATDGRLAFFGASGQPSAPYTLGVFVIKRPIDSVSYLPAFTSTEDTFTYAYWSPGDCADSNCRDLALLFTLPEQRGLALRLIRDQGDTFTSSVVGRAVPFYYSFAPDGRRMLWHRYGNRLDIYDIKAQQVCTTLEDVPGRFASPMWSPVDDRLLFGVVNDDPAQTDLVVAEGAQRRTLVKGIEGGLAFAWSPDASKIAYTAANGKVTVIDSRSGEIFAAGNYTNTVAFFWSPQGDRIATIRLNRTLPGLSTQYSPNGHTTGASLQQATLSWVVMDAATGQSSTLAEFFPTRDMIYYLNFADQFSRSHRLWSPDGRYVVYATADSEGNNRVMLADTHTPDTTTVVQRGTFGVWSW